MKRIIIGITVTDGKKVKERLEWFCRGREAIAMRKEFMYQSLSTGWDQSSRGDWMISLVEYFKVNDRAHTLAKGLFANSVRHLMTDKRSLDAIDAAIAYGHGKITRKDLRDAQIKAWYAIPEDGHVSELAENASDIGVDWCDMNDFVNLETMADICREVLTEEISKVISNLDLNEEGHRGIVNLSFAFERVRILDFLKIFRRKSTNRQLG